MVKSKQIRWYQRDLPRPLVVVVVALALAALLLAISPWRSQLRPDRAGWVHLEWKFVAGPHGAAVFSAHLKRRSEEVTLQLVSFRPKEFDLVVLDNGPSRATPRFGDLRRAMQSRGCIAGVNGGLRMG